MMSTIKTFFKKVWYNILSDENLEVLIKRRKEELIDVEVEETKAISELKHDLHKIYSEHTNMEEEEIHNKVEEDIKEVLTNVE